MDVDYDASNNKDVRMHVQSIGNNGDNGDEVVQTSSSNRRGYGIPHTSSSATRPRHERLLDDCIQKYVDEHKYMVTETIGPERVKSLIKACFTTVSQDPTLLSAVRTPGVNNKHSKRQGAKAVKKLERIHSSGDLSPVEATGFRALSARAKDLALGIFH